MASRVVASLVSFISCLMLSAYSFASLSEDELTFGALIATNKGDMVRSSGAKLVGLCGYVVGWDMLMPDGKHFDEAAIRKLDTIVKDAHRNGLEILLRLKSGGNGNGSFKALKQSSPDYPVDLTEYKVDGPSKGYKNGEYLGNKVTGPAGQETDFPPKILTDDSPGNTSPWYDYCYAIASRYNGQTPDPSSPGELLPEIMYFSTTGEMDTTHYWYGTTSDYFGVPDKNGTMIGYLPSLYRAVKAANPRVKVLEGGFSSPGMGWCVVHYVAEQEGEVNQRVLDYNTRYFKCFSPHTWFDVDGLRKWLYDNPEVERTRRYLDKCLQFERFWDIFCFHSYEDYLMHDTIRFLKTKLAEHGIDKPIWGREIGVQVDFLQPQTKTDVAVRLLKKFVSSFAEGVQVCSISPFIEWAEPVGSVFPGLYTFGAEVARFFNPSMPVSEIDSKYGTPMLSGYRLLSKYLSDCRIEEYELNGTAAIYVFSNKTQSRKVVIGWSERTDDQLFLNDYVSPEEFEKISLYDSLGNSKGAALPEKLTDKPFILVLETSGLVADAGEDIIAVMGDTVVLQGEAFYSNNKSEKVDGKGKFLWTQVCGPTVPIEGQGSPTVAFVAAYPGTYEFQLVVTDGSSTSPPDTVVVQVLPGAMSCSTHPNAGSSLINGVANILIWLTPAFLSILLRGFLMNPGRRKIPATCATRCNPLIHGTRT